MPVDTATIRVSRETRDLLAEQARVQGVSLAALLRRLARDAALRSERQATQADAASPDVAAEEREWEAALGDGVD